VLGYTPPAPVAPDVLADGGQIAGYLTELTEVRLEVQVVAPDDPESGLQMVQWEVVPRLDLGQLQLSTGGVDGLSPQDGGDSGGTGGTLATIKDGTAGGDLLGGTSGSSGGGTFSPPHGIVPGASAGTYTVQLTSEGMRQLNSAEPGTRYELRLRTINQAGVPSAVHRAAFTLPKPETREGDQKRDGEVDPRGRSR
jgi:hypothetical protein